MANGVYVTPDLVVDFLNWIRQDSGLLVTWPSLIVKGSLPQNTDKLEPIRYITAFATGGDRSQEYPQWRPRLDIWVSGPQGYEADVMMKRLLDTLTPYPPGVAGFRKGGTNAVNCWIEAEPQSRTFPSTNWPGRFAAIRLDVRLAPAA